MALGGCRKTEEVPETSQEETGDRLQIGLSFESYVIERWIRERDVFVSAAKELGADVNVQNANGDVQEQIAQIEYFIRKQMDVIAVVAGDCDALSDVMKKAKDAGIKTVSYDRLINNSDCDLYISFNNELVGRLMEMCIRDSKCWPAFQTQFGFVPCYVNSRLTGRGIPVSCEVDKMCIRDSCKSGDPSM